MKSEYSKSGVRLRDKKYLDWIKCCGCVWGSIWDTPAGPCQGDIVPMHGKPWGRGMKGPDYETLPGCVCHHNSEHQGQLEIKEPARSKLVLALNEAYCKQNNITLTELRGK
jgi:hypothetical protein